jgi:hypothetical protein
MHDLDYALNALLRALVVSGVNQRKAIGQAYNRVAYVMSVLKEHHDWVIPLSDDIGEIIHNEAPSKGRK